ncbi:DNA polymerase III subunit alpha, partial [bacterium]|nr:DNA polymerase III subunit alpha [bacterium]
KMPAMAITDHGNMFGAIEFYQQMSRAGIKPIIGYEAYIAPTSRFDKSPSSGEGTAHHATLLAKDTTGYENLMKLATLAYLEGFYYKPRIDMELLSLHREGLIFLSGCIKGRAARFISKGQAKEAKDFILSCLDIFGQENLFLELQDNGIEEQAIANQGLARIAGELSLPLVATNDVHYLNKEDAKAHDALLCIQTGKEMKEEKRLKFSTDSFYLRSADEMKALFSDYPQAISNTIEIAERCNLELDLDNKEKFYLPHYEIQPSAFSLQPSEEGLDDYLANLSHQGLIERYGEPTKEQKDRLDYELKVIKQMGFASYFLIVWDLICYAQDEEIAVGPGRGSAAGSLVSYCLKITDVDPLRYDLLFERFLNPERISMPDIDIDFEDERREEIISYLVKKYGQENIAHIITFGKMLAKQVIRDVGRVLGFPYGDVDKIAKLIPAGKTTLNGAILEVPELAALREDKKFKKIFDIALRLEGLVRHASTHAAAVVISEKPLTNFTPLYKDPKEGTVTTQYAMGPIEAIGLLKMDFLGLRNLTTIKEAVRLIKESKEEEVDIHNIPLDDKATFKLLCRAEGIGLFQLESSGMRDLLRKLKPECFEDLIALLALYRPGPLGSGMVDEFIRGKRKKKRVSYIHPKLSEVLEGTYGVIVYQEQVMKIAQLAANFTLSQADELRKAMSKKMHSQMDSLRASFLEGAVHNGILKGQAEKIFELIFKFAEYGFNKSHSAAYALISYRTAYLKAHYPVEFMAALLTSELSKTDKVHLYISECQRLKIKILPPDINQSVTDFKVGKKLVPGSARGKEIRFGLGAIKNVGEKAIKEIVRQREEKGDFKSLYDFCERLDLRLVNKRVIESLIKAGCFDSSGAKRSQLAASSDHALEVASKIQKDR